jgi:hypothetical protein
MNFIAGISLSAEDTSTSVASLASLRDATSSPSLLSQFSGKMRLLIRLTSLGEETKHEWLPFTLFPLESIISQEEQTLSSQHLKDTSHMGGP